MTVSQISTKITLYTVVHLQCPANHHSQAATQHFSGEGMDKNTAQNTPKHVISSEKKIICPSQTSPSEVDTP